MTGPVLLSPSAAPAPPAPPVASRRRRTMAWVAIALALLLVGGIGAALTQSAQWTQRDALDPDSAGPTGTRALAQILREQGVEVRVARDRQQAARDLADGPATLVLPDAPALSDGALRALTDSAADVVLIEPRSRTLALLLPGAASAGVAPGGATDPECDVADALRAGPIAPRGVYDPGTATDVRSCYPAGDGFGLLVGPHPDGSAAALDGRAVLTNEHLARDGNAALSIGLLGRHPLVVWYMPGTGDTDLAAGDPTLGELTPPWVSPVIVLLLIAGIAAVIWRGRRFGPLVAERLPVTVRASETTEGRARLYAQSHDAVHALDQLRIDSAGAPRTPARDSVRPHRRPRSPTPPRHAPAWTAAPRGGSSSTTSPPATTTSSS